MKTAEIYLNLSGLIQNGVLKQQSCLVHRFHMRLHDYHAQGAPGVSETCGPYRRLPPRERAAEGTRDTPSPQLPTFPAIHERDCLLPRLGCRRKIVGSPGDGYQDRRQG